MKITSKSPRLKALLIVPLLVATMPAMTASAVTPAKKAEPDQRAGNAICAQITSLKNTGETALISRISDMNSGFETRLAAFNANHKVADQKVLDLRTDIRTKFTDKIDALASKSNLPADQKVAIETYKTEMLTAEAEREKAVDEARAAYREALLAKITEHQTALKDAATVFRETVTAALQTASETCDKGNALQSLRTSIKTARMVFKEARDLSSIQDDVEQLMTTRREAVKTANDIFRKSSAHLSRELAQTLKNQ
jgi:hypothetical protein